MTEEMYNACRSELIIYHPSCAIGYFAAKRMGIPAVLAAPFPMHKRRRRHRSYLWSLQIADLLYLYAIAKYAVDDIKVRHILLFEEGIWISAR